MPNGQWNTIEIYVLRDKAVHLINGHVALYLENAHLEGGEKPLTSGQIQIQSEAAKCTIETFASVRLLNSQML